MQRVTEAAVTVEGETVGKCGPGLLILVCAMHDDDEAGAERLAAKVAKLRIFRDAEGRMNRSLLDAESAALVVSQFTLAADTSRDNRPRFSNAAPPEMGRHLYDDFTASLAALGVAVETGQFAGDMRGSLVNDDGPVTIWIEA